jgi:hypothetical protein
MTCKIPPTELAESTIFRSEVIMSLHPQPVPPVPDETTRVALAASPKGNLFLRMRDEVGPLFSDAQFAALFPPRLRTKWRAHGYVRVEPTLDAEENEAVWKRALAEMRERLDAGGAGKGVR